MLKGSLTEQEWRFGMSSQGFILSLETEQTVRARVWVWSWDSFVIKRHVAVCVYL